VDNLTIVKLAFGAAALVFAGQALSDFPVVDPVLQQMRDATRRHILGAELDTERGLLSAARAALANATADQRARLQKDVDLHAENIRALNDELAAGRSAAAASTVRATARKNPAPVPSPNTDAVPFWDVYRRSPTADQSASEMNAGAVSH
jgi:hypothetical protein